MIVETRLGSGRIYFPMTSKDEGDLDLEWTNHVLRWFGSVGSPGHIPSSLASGREVLVDKSFIYKIILVSYWDTLVGLVVDLVIGFAWGIEGPAVLAQQGISSLSFRTIQIRAAFD